MPKFSFASLHLCVFALIFFSLSCGSKPTDLRTLAPAETLVYLETNDLGAALQPIVDSKPFGEVAKSKPDLSALKGVQLAVAITGFEIAEEKLTDEHSVGRVQPHFVAIADTHAWNYQAVSFAEKKLGAFVENIYDSEPTLEKSDKNGGRYFVWTAKDGRKAYALVIDSLIFFGNDETAIDKCLAVRRGLADSIVKTGKVPPADPATLASGYVSTIGIAQIANIVGLKFASETSEDSDVQSAIAGILPQLLRNSITEINWTATKTEQGIEDKYLISMPPDIANVFNETMAPGENVDPDVVAQLPDSTASATLYNLKDPQIALRSFLLVASKQTDPIAGRIMTALWEALFEPYGIRDPEMFLSAISNRPGGKIIVSARLDPENPDPVVLVMHGDDFYKLLKTLSPDLKPSQKIIEGSINTWTTPDGALEAIYDLHGVKIGSKANLDACFNYSDRQISDVKSDFLRKISATKAAVASAGQDRESSAAIADLLSEKKSDAALAVSTYFTETRFTRTGIERRTVSDFGLIGSIIAQLNPE